MAEMDDRGRGAWRRLCRCRIADRLTALRDAAASVKPLSRSFESILHRRILRRSHRERFAFSVGVRGGKSRR